MKVPTLYTDGRGVNVVARCQRDKESGPARPPGSHSMICMVAQAVMITSIDGIIVCHLSYRGRDR